MKLYSIFVDDSATLRSGWRLCVILAAALFTGVALATLAQAVLAGAGIELNDRSAGSIILNSGISLIAALGAGWFAGKVLEGLPFRALGSWFTKGWLKHLIAGLILGMVAVSFAVLIAVVFGGLRFEFNTAQGSTAIWITLGLSFVIFAVAAAFEEAFLRGYFLQTFLRSGLPWFGIVLTSSLFGVLHFANPEAGIISTLNTILAGFWFCVAYLKTRDLWLAWGSHLMWNWTQGAIFGIEVSGLTDIVTAPLLTEIDHGPVWLTGENYGIEGGITCTIALVIFIAVTYKMPFFEPAEEMVAFTTPSPHVEPTPFES